MFNSELCEKVKALCKENNKEFFFIVDGWACWSVKNNEHIKAVAKYHQETENVELLAKIKRLVPDCRNCKNSGCRDEEYEIYCGQCQALAFCEIKKLLFCDDEVPF